MSISKITRHFLALSLFAALGSSCGNNGLLPLASSISPGDDLFSTLADDSTETASSTMQERIAQFKAEHPELAAQLEALKDLSPEERRAKVQELRENNPELLKQLRSGHKMFGRKGHAMMPKFGHRGHKADFAGKKPDFAAFKDLSPEERQAKLEELKANFTEAHPEKAAQLEAMKARFLEAHPELAAKIEELKALSPEERQAKLEAYKAEFTQAKGNMKKAFPGRKHRPHHIRGHFQGKHKHFVSNKSESTEQTES